MQISKRIKKIAVKSVIAGSGLIASGLSVSAWNGTDYAWSGMGNLSTFIADVVALIPNLIPLVVVGTIIAVVYKFRDFITKIIKI